ncbi:deoxycytidylate deaminase-like [Sitophilus oryzae]|uniref:dCMP deaminase n=1 Tax=Sitophilus oryzae TaxID=7048 RepID=A0A6J2YGW6_SITOR|nr:deoxycytidylate deaminase-like [Sitophilus oryzae]
MLFTKNYSTDLSAGKYYIYISLRRIAMDVSTEPRNLNGGREDVLEQSDYFMATAFLTAQQSRDPCTQVGAVIVNERNIIVGIGHNKMPNGCENFMV